MKRFKITLALLLVFGLISSLAVGCGSGGEKAVEQTTSTTASTAAPASGTTAPVEDPFKDPMEISIAMWDVEQGFPEGQQDAVYDLIKKKFNITIKPVNTTWDDYAQKIQVWAASSQLPDIFVIDAIQQPYYKTWVAEKLVRPLPDDLSNYPNIQKLLEPSDFQAYRDPGDGKFYNLPKPAYSEEFEVGCEKAIYYRKDWMEKVGITKVPETTDEFITLMKAFMQADPEGTGTVGLTAYDRSAFTNIMLSYVPGLTGGSNHWIKEDGKWTQSFLSKQALPGLKEMKRIYDAGCIDKDIAVIKGEEGLDKFCSGRAGALCYGGTPGFQVEITTRFDKNYPDKKYGDSVLMTHFWKAMDGVEYRNTMMRPWSEDYYNAKTVDDKKMDRILRLSDYLLSDEGLTLLRFGIEGTDYKKEGDKIVVTRKTDDKGAFLPIFDPKMYPSTQPFSYLVTWDQSFMFNDPSYDPSVAKMSNDLREWSKNATPVATDFRLDFLDFPSKNKVSYITSDEVVKIMMNKDVEKSYNDVVKGLYDNGLQQMIDDVNAAAVKAGIN